MTITPTLDLVTDAILASGRPASDRPAGCGPAGAPHHETLAPRRLTNRVPDRTKGR
ncbi:hypothetical protein [Cryptosporangium sp. NPDC051539]|uniref:hypothetical protein n=1 Tax=Cryptosporangium sp. NPDC051539 TaxID=3363962 RepID=UPI00379BFE65